MDVLYDNIVVPQVFLINGLIFLRSVCLGKEDFHRHERAVFFDDFSDTVFIGELQAVFVQIQGDFRSDRCLIAVLHVIFGASITFPVNRGGTIFVGQGVDMHIVCNHERRVKAKSKVTDHLICIGLVFVFLQKFCCAGKCDLGDVFFHFVGSHTDTVIDKFQSLFFRIYDHLDAGFVIFRKLVFAHAVQFFQFCNGVAAVGNQLTNENVMIRVHPFFYDRENIVAVD